MSTTMKNKYLSNLNEDLKLFLKILNGKGKYILRLFSSILTPFQLTPYFHLSPYFQSQIFLLFKRVIDFLLFSTTFTNVQSALIRPLPFSFRLTITSIWPHPVDIFQFLMEFDIVNLRFPLETVCSSSFLEYYYLLSFYVAFWTLLIL